MSAIMYMGQLKQQFGWLKTIRRYVWCSEGFLRAILVSSFLILALYLTADVHNGLTWLVKQVRYLSPGRPSFLLITPDNISHFSSPYNINQLLPDDHNRLMNINNFSFLLKGPICNGSNPPFLVGVVHTTPLSIYNRKVIRETWGLELHIVFFVGIPDSTEVQTNLLTESHAYHDIVQGNFKDSTRNLTYKHVMVLKWMTYYCPGATYILKMDDDGFVNTPALDHFLHTELSPLGARQLIMCDVHHGLPGPRHDQHIWEKARSEHMFRRFSPFCAGWAVLYSPDTVFRLYKEAQKNDNYFWFDDAFVTGTLVRKINYEHTDIGSLAIYEKQTLHLIEEDELGGFLFSLVQVKHRYMLWYMVQAPWYLVDKFSYTYVYGFGYEELKQES